MSRRLMSIVSMLLACVALAAMAITSPTLAKQDWVTLGSVKVDPSSAGSRTITVGEAKGGFRELRLEVDGSLKTSRATVQFANPRQSMRVLDGASIEPGKPLILWGEGAGRVVTAVGMSWPAVAGAAPVTVTLKGLQDEAEAKLTVAEEAGDTISGAVTGAMIGGIVKDGAPTRQSQARTPETAKVAPPPPDVAPPPVPSPPPSRGLQSPSTGRTGAAPPPVPSPPPSDDQNRVAAGGRIGGGAASPPAAAPPPSRGMVGAAPPPPMAAAPKPAPAPRTADRDEPATKSVTAAAKPAVVGPESATAPDGVCLKDNVCTPVPVFFGSSRNQLTTPAANYVSFGYERPDKLTLGRTIVTVPKARKAGTIPTTTTLEWLRGVPREGLPDRHFTIPKNGVKIYDSEDAFLAEAKKHIAEAGESRDHAFIYVHGFAVSFENAMYRAAQISYDLGKDGKPFGTAFVYTWPSKGSILPTAYVYDGESAEYAIPHFRKFVELVTQKTGVKNVHVIAHSMGNRVLMRALDEAVREGSPAWINQVILAAPDVDKQAFERLAKNIAGAARGLTLYASQQDNALRISRNLRGDRAPPRAGEVAPPAGPAVVTGVDTIDISALSTAYFLPDLDSHDKYADSPEMLNDIAAIFAKNKPPPETRNAKFKKATFQALEYWRYAK